MVERVGAAISEEARRQGVDVVLGPGVNIKRHPLCGRNFEYFSEDVYKRQVLNSLKVVENKMREDRRIVEDIQNLKNTILLKS